MDRRAKLGILVFLFFGWCLVHGPMFGHPALLPFAILGPVFLMLAAQEPGVKRPFRTGWLAGLVFFGTNMIWLAQFISRWSQSHLLGFFPYALAVMIMALNFGVFVWLGQKLSAKRAAWLPVLWVAIEFFRAEVPYLGFPWALSHFPLSDLPGIHLVSLRNPYWTSYLVATIAFLLSRAFLPAKAEEQDAAPSSLPRVAGLTLFFGAAAYIVQPRPMLLTGPDVSVAVAQLGVDLAFDPNASLKVPRAVLQLRQKANAQAVNAILILPEGLADLPDGKTPSPWVRDVAPVIFGAKRGSHPSYQSSVADDGRSAQFSDKERLVIFGEYVPFRNIIPYPKAFQLPGGDLAPGKFRAPLELGGRQFAPLICFEALFPSLARQRCRVSTSAVVIQSVDDWYQRTMAMEVFRSAAIWCAISSNRTVLRSGSLGPTMIISANGEIKDALPYGEPGILVTKL